MWDTKRVAVLLISIVQAWLMATGPLGGQTTDEPGADTPISMSGFRVGVLDPMNLRLEYVTFNLTQLRGPAGMDFSVSTAPRTIAYGVFSVALEPSLLVGLPQAGFYLKGGPSVIALAGPGGGGGLIAGNVGIVYAIPADGSERIRLDVTLRAFRGGGHAWAMSVGVFRPRSD